MLVLVRKAEGRYVEPDVAAGTGCRGVMCFQCLTLVLEGLGDDMHSLLTS